MSYVFFFMIRQPSTKYGSGIHLYPVFGWSVSKAYLIFCFRIVSNNNFLDYSVSG